MGGRLGGLKNVGRGLQWSFVPAQKSVKVVPGEAALAFYTVTNKSKRDITGTTPPPCHIRPHAPTQLPTRAHTDIRTHAQARAHPHASRAHARTPAKT